MSTKKKSRQELQLLRDEALEAYLNREDFQYDLNADELYRQYKDRYVELGKQAMTDTMGQAAALTGGYGSSYAQSAGQQAYHSYLSQLEDVVPELYQLAYDRYQHRGDSLYKTYQAWAQLEREEAEREKAIVETDEVGAENAYWAWLAYHQGKGTRTDPNDPTKVFQYDNQDVSTGNIMIMQRVIGRPETGMWTVEDKARAGKMDANTAWDAYQKGQLQNRYSHGMGDMGLSNDRVRVMERVLGLREDGYWSEEDKKAAGGMTEAQAWTAYQQGKLQFWR